MEGFLVEERKCPRQEVTTILKRVSEQIKIKLLRVLYYRVAAKGLTQEMEYHSDPLFPFLR